MCRHGIRTSVTMHVGESKKGLGCCAPAAVEVAHSTDLRGASQRFDFFGYDRFVQCCITACAHQRISAALKQ
eukprot:SAG11_NODE_2475_length_3316_cov_2.668635_1_plen_72_part_00